MSGEFGTFDPTPISERLREIDEWVTATAKMVSTTPSSARRSLREILCEAIGEDVSPDILAAMLHDGADRFANPEHKGNKVRWPQHADMLRALARALEGRGPRPEGVRVIWRDPVPINAQDVQVIAEEVQRLETRVREAEERAEVARKRAAKWRRKAAKFAARHLRDEAEVARLCETIAGFEETLAEVARAHQEAFPIEEGFGCPCGARHEIEGGA